MKQKIKLLIGILGFLLILSAEWTTAWAGNDKLKHLGVSSLFGAASESYLHYKTNLKSTERVLLATSLGSLPGLTKELIDSTEPRNHFSKSDMAINIAGAFLGALAGNFFNTLIQAKMETTEKSRTIAFSLSYSF